MPSRKSAGPYYTVVSLVEMLISLHLKDHLAVEIFQLVQDI